MLNNKRKCVIHEIKLFTHFFYDRLFSHTILYIHKLSHTSRILSLGSLCLNLYFKMKGCLLFPNVSRIFIFKGEHSPQYDYICSHCVSKNSLSMWRTLIPRFVFAGLHCYYMTRKICGIKQVIIVAFFCCLPIMFTLFPSLAITSFLRFSRPGINCYYKHQSSAIIIAAETDRL